MDSEVNRTLKALDVEWNGFGADSTARLADALKVPTREHREPSGFTSVPLAIMTFVRSVGFREIPSRTVLSTVRWREAFARR